MSDILSNPFKYSIGTRIRENIILRMIQPTKTDVILDMGCGLGYFTDFLTRHDKNVIGIDIDETCIKFCRQNLKGTYIVSNVLRTPFVNETFDKVLCTEVIEHIPNTHEILGNIYRLLRPGGVLIATVPCSEGVFGLRIKNISHDHVDHTSLEYHHHKGFTYENFAQLLKQNGFRVIAHDYTLVCVAELIMGITKIACNNILRHKIASQADAIEISKKWFWKPYCFMFPLLLKLGTTEQPLSHKLKGHMLIVKAIKE